jgi:large subunit ribosomal protein L29
MTKKTAEILELPDDELLARLDHGKEELFNLRFQMATGQLDNPMRLKQVRHEIARILTVLRQRNKEEEVEVAVARSEQGALERSRAAQASGELKGTPLGEAITEVPSDAEPMEMGAPVAGPEFEPHGSGEKRPRRLLRRRRKGEATEEEAAAEADADAATAQAEPEETEPEPAAEPKPEEQESE